MWMLLNKLEHIRGEDVYVCEDSGVLSLVLKKNFEEQKTEQTGAI